jgi:hypothetical protein
VEVHWVVKDPFLKSDMVSDLEHAQQTVVTDLEVSEPDF